MHASAQRAQVNDTLSCDLLVIGGGINGAGVARDAAGRGLSVILCERDDLAQHTSSASTKLIHGGLRYLELYDFALVRHSLQEREVLWRLAPHIIWPLRFILPHHRALRPGWLIRLGLFIYDHIGGRDRLPSSRRVNLQQHVAGRALQGHYRTAFEYSDCWVQDARLVVLTCMDARSRGAKIFTHTRCDDLQRHTDHWVARLVRKEPEQSMNVRCRAVVNAAGPWVVETLNLDKSLNTSASVRLVKGSHIVVPKLFEHEYPYIFQNADGRIVFAIPYEHEFTLIGTTELEIDSTQTGKQINKDEIAYLCENVSEYFQKPLKPDSVVWSFSGVRPLYDDAAEQASKVTRDYNLHLDTRAAPLLSVFGGKITTYRKLAEEVMALLKTPMGISQKNWTANSPLPGGDFAGADFPRFLDDCKARYDGFPEELIADYARNYGTNIHNLLSGCISPNDLGQCYAENLYEREVAYLRDNEWAASAEDILWRRTKKGLHVSENVADELDAWFAATSLTTPAMQRTV